MCYSAQVQANFRKYQRLGGEMDIKEFVALAERSAKAGRWVTDVPKALRNSFMDADPDDAEQQEARAAALEAYRATALKHEQEIATQTERLMQAEAVLAGPKPTKKATNDKRVATNRIAAARAKLAQVEDFAAGEGFQRIWPGHYAPVLIRDPATGQRMVVPMRYRVRLKGWTVEDELQKPGTYNARKDKLSTVWRELWGHNHGIIRARRFYEAVRLHDLQRRELAPGEPETSVEIEFAPIPEPEEGMYLACLWRYSPPTDDEPGFYSFAVITREPPPEVAAAGHNRCIIPIKPEHLQAWLNPDAKRIGEQLSILEDPIEAYFEHALVGADDDESP